MKLNELYRKVATGTASNTERKQFLDVYNKMQGSQDGKLAYNAYAKDPDFLKAVDIAVGEASGQSLSQQAVDQAKQNYGDRAPYREYGTQALDAAGMPSLDGPWNPDQEFQDFSPVLTDYTTDPRRGQALDKILNGPDRVQLVRQYLADMDTAAEPVLAKQYADVGRSASTLGRLGSGQVTTDLGNVLSDYQRNRTLAGNEAIRGATEADVGDRLNAYGAVSNFDDTNYGRASSRANEQRGERGVRYGLGREGLANRMDVQNRRFGQAITAGGFGYGNDPTQALQTGANFDSNTFWRGKEFDAAQDAQNQNGWQQALSYGAQLIPYGSQVANFYGKTQAPKGRSTSGYGYSTGPNYG